MSVCLLPPPGWWCSRDGGHTGPCAARRLDQGEFRTNTAPDPPHFIVTFSPWGELYLDGGRTKWPEKEVEEMTSAIRREFFHTAMTPQTLRTIEVVIERWVHQLIQDDKIRYNMFESRWEAVVPIEEVWDRRETD